MTNDLLKQEPIWLQDHQKRYELLDILGQGGMGKVYRAFDHRLKRNVAIKLLRQDEKTASIESQILFLREAQTTAQLNHPYIIPVYDAGYWDGQGFYLVMKEVKGQNLDRLIKEFHRLSEGWYTASDQVKHLTAQTWLDFCVILRQVAQAIGFAHKQGALHRDLKPENIMIGQDGEVWVLDWGLARSVNLKVSDFKSSLSHAQASSQTGAVTTPPIRPVTMDDFSSDTIIAEEITHDRSSQNHSSQNQENQESQLSSKLTFTGVISGTPAYMSPEQAKALALDSRCDTYALGAILYEILSNRAPYVGGNAYQIIEKVITEDIQSLDHPELWVQTPLLKTAPNALKKLAMKALSRDLAERFIDGSAFAQALKEIERGADLYDRAQEAYEEGLKLFAEIKQAQVQLDQVLVEIDLFGEQRSANVGLFWRKKIALEQEIQDHQIREMAEYQRAVLICPDHLPAIETFCQRLLENYQDTYLKDRKQPKLIKIEKQLLELQQLLPTHHDFNQKIKTLLNKQRPIDLQIESDFNTAKIIYVDSPISAFATLHQKPVLQYQWTKNQLQNPNYLFKLGSYQLEIDYQLSDGSPQTQAISYEHYPSSINDHPKALRLPTQLPIGPKVVYIPNGTFRYGSDQGVNNEVPTKLIDLPDFWITTTNIRYEEYQLFLNDCLASKGEAETEKHVPVSRMTVNFGVKAYDLIDGQYQINEVYRTHYSDYLKIDRNDFYVNFVNWFDAQAYAKYLTKVTKRTWRLPFEWEWEKAGRGCDGRLFPWHQLPGDLSDQSIRDFQKTSPYGVKAMSGLMGSWCLNPKASAYPVESKEALEQEKRFLMDEFEDKEGITPHPTSLYNRDFSIRGGGYFNTGLNRSLPYRFSAAPKRTFADVGIRLITEAIDSDFT